LIGRMTSETKQAAPQRGRWIGIATALMTALAGGAVWCVLALYARHDLIALSLPIAAAIVWALRANGYGGRPSGAAIAVVCVALACAYSLYLQAAAQIASLLGLSMRAALVQIEPRMAVDIAWANLDAGGAMIFICACVFAAIAMVWPLHRKTNH
jgi:hypothetical protein